ncbi:MAG: hypothetical protein Q9215_004871 [Flavoplaca cf. flavocitrina]
MWKTRLQPGCLGINEFNPEHILEESGGAMVAVKDCLPPGAKVANNDADEGKATMPPPSACWLVCKKLRRKATLENHEMRQSRLLKATHQTDGSTLVGAKDSGSGSANSRFVAEQVKAIRKTGV